jgi:sarcosine oxidase, subunit beta
MTPRARGANRHTRTMSDPVVVIGAGVVGCSVAFAASRAGLQVTLVDSGSGPGQGSTSASSAIVRMHYSTFEGVALAWEAKHAWEQWQQHLGYVDPAGMARYVPTGALVLDSPAFDGERTLALYDRLGIPYERLSPAQLRDRFPYLSADRFYPPRLPDDPQFWQDPTDELGGFYTPEGGFVDDPALATHNLWAAATATGTESVFGRMVASVERDTHGVRGVILDDGQTIAAPVVVNAAGPYSAAVNRMAAIGADFGVTTRPMRQEVHVLDGPPELAGELGPTVGDSDLGAYFRFLPGGRLLVGSQEPECDPLEWLDDPRHLDDRASATIYERQSLRLARRFPSVQVPSRPRGLAALYDVTEDWIPIYDHTELPGFFVAIGTSGNQFKNAPTIGLLILALIENWLAGGDHDTDPVHWTAPRTGSLLNLAHYSRRRTPNPDSSYSVLG